MEAKLNKARKRSEGPNCDGDINELWIVRNGAMTESVAQWLSEHDEYQNVQLVVVGNIRRGEKPVQKLGCQPAYVSDYDECDRLLSTLV